MVRSNEIKFVKQHVQHIILFAGVVSFCSCSVMEKSSRHGFESGYYQLKSDNKNTQKVFADITEKKVVVYPLTANQLSNHAMTTISLETSDSLCHFPVHFIKKSLDIDITSVLFKYRPGISDLPAQMTVDFNAALYAGWRHDSYRVKSKMSPLGNCSYEITGRGYDVGFFAGPGTTTVGSFATRNVITNEYDGMILQFGMAGFLESNVASFGIGLGFDYLLSKDSKVWIYNGKPWMGFIIGIALN